MQTPGGLHPQHPQHSQHQASHAAAHYVRRDSEVAGRGHLEREHGRALELLREDTASALVGAAKAAMAAVGASRGEGDEGQRGVGGALEPGSPR